MSANRLGEDIPLEDQYELTLMGHQVLEVFVYTPPEEKHTIEMKVLMQIARAYRLGRASQKEPK